jgi:hypothetical protein
MLKVSPPKFRFRPAAICAALGAASAMAVGGALVAPTVADAATANVAQFHMLDDADSTTVADAAKYQIVQLQYSPTVKTLVDAIHANDPGVKVLMYTDAVPPGTGGSTDGWTTCTTSTEDAAGGDSWYMYDGGSRLSSMNSGNSAYQAACTSHATSLAKSADFDGVFWDEVSPEAAFSINGSCVNGDGDGSCWSSATWQANEYSFVKAIGAASSADGLMAIINDGTGSTSQFEQWASVPGISGSMEESFVGSYTGNSVPYSQWQEELANEAWSEANGKYFMAVHYDPNQNQESLDTYGLASMLLNAGGMTSYDSTITTLNAASYDWWPEYTAAQSLGAPSGGYTTVTSGSATVYERKFANGIVVVNPTTSGSASVSLGATYNGTGNEPANVTSVTLPAQTGMILTN